MGILFWEIMFFDYSAEQFDQRESFGRKEKKGKLLQSESLLASDVAAVGATHTHTHIYIYIYIYIPATYRTWQITECRN